MKPIKISTPQAILDLLRQRPLPYDSLRSPQALAHYPAVFDRLLHEGKRDFLKILRQQPAQATFDSVARAMMEIGVDLTALWEILSNHHHTSGNDVTRALIERYQPKIAAFGNALSLNADLYVLLRRVKKSRAHLTEAEQRSLHLMMRAMEVAGVHLLEKKKTRIKAINLRMGKLSEKFNENVTASRNAFFHHFATDESLQDVPPQEKEMAKAEAKNRKLPGYVFTLSPPSMLAVLRYCTDREIRKKFLAAHHSVAASGKHDNRPLILEMLRLRHEKARLLGYKTFADCMIADRMAEKPANVHQLLKTVIAHARTRAKKDVKELQAFAHLPDFQPWDVGFFAQQLRKKKYEVNDNELKQFFPLNRALDGLFVVAKRLFDLDFRHLSSSEDVIVYEVRRGGKKIGEFLQDLFARPAKRPGAWSTAFSEPIFRNGAYIEHPIAFNAANFGKSMGKEPSLLRHGEVVTLFHEFGHALHNLLSENSERNLHSFHVEWDFIELPSQLLENWCWDARSLRLFARHWKTGKPLPHALLKRLKESKTFMQGMDTLTQTEFAMFDLLLHSRTPPKTVAELDRFARSINGKFAVLPVPDFQKRHASFSHIFAGGYCAGYYSYLWAEVLEADVYSRFEKAGPLNRKTGDRFRREILAVGTGRPAKVSFRAFMGRKPDPRALLRKRGLV